MIGRAPLAFVATVALAWCGAVAAPATAMPDSARPTIIGIADDAASPISVDVDTLLPLAPRASDTLTIRGTVANTSGSVVPQVTVRLRVGTEPLSSRSSVAAVASGSVDSAGNPVDGTRTVAIAQLLPGQSAPFTISVPMATLDLPQRGVYQLAFEAQSDPGDGNLQRVGLLRTFLPWLPDPVATPSVGLVTVWPLTETPAVASDGVLINDQIPRALAPGGRLRVLVDAVATHSASVTWVVDPALLETVAHMANGYRIRLGTDTVAGDRPGDAGDWLDDVRRLTANADVLAMPYAAPDDVALVRGNLGRDVVRSITTAAPAASGVLGRPVPSTIAWPTNGLTDEITLRVLSDAGPRAVLLADRQLRSTSDFTPSGTAPIPGTAGSGTAVVPDGILSAVLAAPHRTTTDVIVGRQRLLAELAQIALEKPDVPRTVVMAPPVAWTSTSAFLTEALTAVNSVPWVHPTTLATLLGGEPSSVPRILAGYPESARASELPGAYVSRLAQAQRSTELLGDVVSGAAPTTVPLAASLMRASSGGFRSQLPTGAELIRGTRARVDAILGGVRIVSHGSVTLPGDSGIVPLSIANTLSSPVTVGIQMIATPSVRMSITPVDPVVIPAGATKLVEVPARVSGSQPVDLSVRLTSVDGSPFGETAELNVGSSAYSRAAAWVVGFAFAALVLLLLINSVRRVRQARAGSHTPDDLNATMDS